MSGGISKENFFSNKSAASRKSQTLRVPFRESQTAQPVLTGHQKSNAQPVFAGTSSPGWPLENGVFFSIHAYVKLIGFTSLPFWQLRL